MIIEKLMTIQQELKAPKGQRNTFGNYNYRSCEDILEAVKPLCKEQEVVLVLSDEMCCVGDRNYVKATATLIDVEDNSQICNTAYAREEETKKGMDGSQITGASSSYARKYALNGLFAIDDTKDSDATNRGETKLNDKLIKELKELGGTPELVALYFKKDITDLTDEDIKQAIEQKKKNLGE